MSVSHVWNSPGSVKRFQGIWKRRLSLFRRNSFDFYFKGSIFNSSQACFLSFIYYFSFLSFSFSRNGDSSCLIIYLYRFIFSSHNIKGFFRVTQREPRSFLVKITDLGCLPGFPAFFIPSGSFI